MARDEACAGDVELGDGELPRVVNILGDANKSAVFLVVELPGQIKRMGDLKGIIGMLPGMGGAMKRQIDNADVDPKMVNRMEAIILSMTKAERKNPDIIKASRKKRIAAGSGTTVQEVNRLLKQFDDMSTMMKRMSKLGQKGLMRQGIGALMPKSMQPQGGGRRPLQ